MLAYANVCCSETALAVEREHAEALNLLALLVQKVQILERGRWSEEKKMKLERALCLREGGWMEARIGTLVAFFFSLQHFCLFFFLLEHFSLEWEAGLKHALVRNLPCSTSTLLVPCFTSRRDSQFTWIEARIGLPCFTSRIGTQLTLLY
jgi:hypothetical protein